MNERFEITSDGSANGYEGSDRLDVPLRNVIKGSDLQRASEELSEAYTHAGNALVALRNTRFAQQARDMDAALAAFCRDVREAQVEIVVEPGPLLLRERPLK